MDISSAATVSPLSGQAVGDSADNQALRRAQESGARTAAPADEAPKPAKPSSANLPPHLGQNINTTA